MDQTGCDGFGVIGHTIPVWYPYCSLDYRVDISNQSGVAFLVEELDLADKSLDIAETTDNDEIRKRRIERAWVAHEMVSHLITRTDLTDSELLAIVKRLRALTRRLSN